MLARHADGSMYLAKQAGGMDCGCLRADRP